MSSVSSLLKLSPRETLVDEWELLDDAGFPGLGDFFAVLGSFMFFLVAGLFFAWAATSRSSGMVAAIVVLCSLAVCSMPGLFMLWQIMIRPRRLGYLCLTNLRCLYVERGDGFFKNTFRVAATNLHDVVAVHSVYEESLLGVKSIQLVIYTKFEDTIGIHVGYATGFLTSLPLVGALFHRHVLGRDALTVSPSLFQLIHERRAMIAPTGSAY